MNVLVVGSGAREHALAWKLRQSPLVSDLFVAPGNGGSGAVAVNLPVRELDFAAIYAVTREFRIDLVVVGPEAPLAAGLVDFLTERGVPAYGPTRAAAEIESSKVWAKQLMLASGIPTAAARVFDDAGAARRYAEQYVDASGGAPVVKADGLAAGKGVVVAGDRSEALTAIEQALTARAFGDAGRRILLEERLSGREVSAHVISDGERVLALPFACDHKPVFDGDRGPNTGGMGAYSPPGFVDDTLAAEIQETISLAAVRALAREGRPFRGTLFPGLMLTDAGPRVIEFNCRFGDPETEVLLPRLQSDLLPILHAAAIGSLEGVTAEWNEGACVGVVMASGGYPGAYQTGLPIDGLERVDADVQVFHAGTQLADDRLVTAGGRVLTVVARGATIAAARERAYDNVRRIRFEGAHYRGDIGQRELVDAAS